VTFHEEVAFKKSRVLQ
jgi:hypothetical protein